MFCLLKSNHPLVSFPFTSTKTDIQMQLQVRFIKTIKQFFDLVLFTELEIWKVPD